MDQRDLFPPLFLILLYVDHFQINDSSFLIFIFIFSNNTVDILFARLKLKIGITKLIIKINKMLNKYQDFFKLSKHEECAIYTAINRATTHPVLLKRFVNKLSWDEVLKNKNMQFSQKSKMFPKMVEIFRNKKDFYVVYQKPTGNSLGQTEDVAPISLDNFYLLFHDLCQYLLVLKSMVSGLYILPEWIFIHRHTVKIVHYQPFFLSRQALSSDHVYQYKVQNQLLPDEKDEESTASVIPYEKKRNLVFNLGIIAYHLLTGVKQSQPETEEEYLNIIKDIKNNAEKQVYKATNNKQISLLVEKMLCKNMFQIPQLEKIAQKIEAKAKQVMPTKKKQYASNIQIDIQHIKLENSRQKEQNNTEMKKKLRPCCAEKQENIGKINQQIRLNRQSREHKDKQYKQQQQRKSHWMLWGKQSPRVGRSSKKSILPKIKVGPRMKTEGDLMNTTNSKPLMFNNRSFF